MSHSVFQKVINAVKKGKAKLEEGNWAMSAQGRPPVSNDISMETSSFGYLIAYIQFPHINLRTFHPQTSPVSFDDVLPLLASYTKHLTDILVSIFFV